MGGLWQAPRYLKCSKPQQVVRETKLVQQELDFLWKLPAPKSRRAFWQNSETICRFLVVWLVREVLSGWAPGAEMPSSAKGSLGAPQVAPEAKAVSPHLPPPV